MRTITIAFQAMGITIPSITVDMAIGIDTVHNMLSSIPEVVRNGLNIDGDIIVVVGYAMVINMIHVGYLVPFFYLYSSPWSSPALIWCR